ncbi:MAG: NlpC/P60 family protein [Gammaproteobacteria bacterium]
MQYILQLSKFFLISLVLTGCSSTPYKSTPASNITLHDPDTKSKLISQHQEWKGTPYRYGGLSKRGVDCSGFVYLTYRNKFDIDLPRSTEQLSNTGTTISKSQLTSGDLVFFKTGLSKRHVGIYLGDRKFLHASTSKGVTISNLNNVYWRKKYWKAQRI